MKATPASRTLTFWAWGVNNELGVSMRRAFGFGGFWSICGLALIWWAALAPSAGAQVTIYESLTGAEISGILQDEGLPGRVDFDASGDPIVYSQTRGVRFGVLTYDCDDAPPAELP